MSLAACSQDSRGPSLLLASVYVALLLMAVYLAMLRMPSMESPAARCWTLLMAVAMPEFFVIWHGLTTSSAGQPFFGASPFKLPDPLSAATDTMLR